MKPYLSALICCVLAACASNGTAPNTTVAPAPATEAVVQAANCAKPPSLPYTVACAMGRGINLGNVLDAPNEGEWGLSLNEDMFDRIQEAGFATLRLPVRWSNHAAAKAPYTVDSQFFMRVDYAIQAALNRGMFVVLDMHHYHQLDGDALDKGEMAVDEVVLEDRAVAIWQQVAERYKVLSGRLFFELYNEPHGRLTASKWNTLLARMLTTVRASNPNRMVVVGPVQWNNASALKDLVLPVDPRLIVTVHNYEPFHFTHQGAEWVSGSSPWLGTSCCDAAQRAKIVAPLDTAAHWSVAHNIPVWIGEFGSYQKAPIEARAAYTRLVRDEMEQRGLSWAYWEFASGFGLYSSKTKQWNAPLRDALLGL